MSDESKPQPGNTVKLLVFIWFVVMFLVLMYLTNQRLVDFDPDSLLLDNATEATFYSGLRDYLIETHGSVKGRAFHIADEQCFCQMVAGAHIEDVKLIVENESMQNVPIRLTDEPQMKQYLPSVPAIIIYNDQEQLVYIGPYSAGYMCSTGNGLVEDLIPRMDETVTNPVVMSLTRGCYCNISE